MIHGRIQHCERELSEILGWIHYGMGKGWGLKRMASPFLGGGGLFAYFCFNVFIFSLDKASTGQNIMSYSTIIYILNKIKFNRARVLWNIKTLYGRILILTLKNFLAKESRRFSKGTSPVFLFSLFLAETRSLSIVCTFFDYMISSIYTVHFCHVLETTFLTIYKIYFLLFW